MHTIICIPRFTLMPSKSIYKTQRRTMRSIISSSKVPSSSLSLGCGKVQIACSARLSRSDKFCPPPPPPTASKKNTRRKIRTTSTPGTMPGCFRCVDTWRASVSERERAVGECRLREAAPWSERTTFPSNMYLAWRWFLGSKTRRGLNRKLLMGGRFLETLFSMSLKDFCSSQSLRAEI